MSGSSSMRFGGVIAAAILALLLQSCSGSGGTKVGSSAERVEACAEASERRDESAISLCDTALGTEGLSEDLRVRAFVARGIAHRNKRDYPAAAADFTKALALRSDAWTYHQRAIAYSRKGDFAGAIGDLDHAIALKPDDAKLYNDRGWARMMRGDSAPALTDMSRAAELEPKSDRIYQNLATYHFIQGDFKAAIAHIERARELVPENPYNYIWLYIAMRRDQRDPAEVLRSASRAAPVWPEVMIRFIQGRASELEVHAAVGSGPYGAISEERDCLSQLILGQLVLLDQWKETAAAHFRYASRACPIGQIDRIIADAELKRM